MSSTAEVRGQVTVAPIERGDLPEVGAFLHAELNPRLSAADWARMAMPTWWTDQPNHGFWLRDGDEVVGVYLAFYSERPPPAIGGDGPTLICNLAAWCVRESHRAHGVRLLRAMLGQRGYVFTDLSPSGSVVPLNLRMRFTPLDTTTVAVPNLPAVRRPRGVRLVSDPWEARKLLPEGDRERYVDHEGAAAAIQLVLVDGDRTCHVVARRDRRKRLPLFATLLHASDRELFARHERLVYQHLLLRHHAIATLVELRLVDHQPRGRLLANPRPRMVRGDLPADQVDYLYSELTCVAW